MALLGASSAQGLARQRSMVSSGTQGPLSNSGAIARIQFLAAGLGLKLSAPLPAHSSIPYEPPHRQLHHGSLLFEVN